MKQFKFFSLTACILLSACATQGHRTIASSDGSPTEPVHGNYDPQKLLGDYKIVQIHVNAQYSSSSQDEDITNDRWLAATFTAKKSGKTLTFVDPEDENGALASSFTKINAGKIPQSFDGAGKKLRGFTESYTTQDGVFFKSVLTDSTTHVPGFPDGFSWYKSARIKVTADGIQVDTFESSCPGMKGSCGPVTQADIYSSTTLYSATLKKK